jgi:hypothetical protein
VSRSPSAHIAPSLYCAPMTDLAPLDASSLPPAEPLGSPSSPSPSAATPAPSGRQKARRAPRAARAVPLDASSPLQGLLAAHGGQLTQVQIASLLGVKQPTVAEALSRERRGADDGRGVGLATVARWADALGFALEIMAVRKSTTG